MTAASIAEMNDLLARQRAAFLAEPNRSLKARREDLKKIEAITLDNQQAWVEAVSADFGHRNALETRLLELSVVARGVKDMRHKLAGWMKPQRVSTPLMSMPGRSYVRPDPKGVVGIVSPWNYPLALAITDAIPALLAGVHLHGAAADRLVGNGIGPIGLAAGEVSDAARRIFNEWCAA